MFGTPHRKGKEPPSWYDDDNDRECDHDIQAVGTERVRDAVGYSEFGFFRSRCGASGCEETWDWYIEG